MATTEQLDDWKAKLAAAELAYAGLISGGSVVLVQTGDRRVQFSESNRGALLAYINRLKRLIAGTCGGAGRINYPVPL
jgi:hypothetical protein